MHIQKYGPASNFATEAYESFNSVIREWCIHSNRQAPSLDTARHAAGWMHIRHLSSGGFFQELSITSDNQQPLWKTIGGTPLEYINSSPIIAQKVGLSKQKIYQIGKISNWYKYMYPMSLNYSRLLSYTETAKINPMEPDKGSQIFSMPMD